MYSKASNHTGASFSLKISALYAAFFILASVSLLATTYYLIERSVREDERQLVNTQAEEYRAWFVKGGLPALRARFLETSRRSKELFFIRVIGPNNKTLFISIPHTDEAFQMEELQSLPVELNSFLSLRTKSGRSRWTVAAIRLPNNLMLEVGKNSDKEEQLLAELRSVFVMVVLPILLLGTVGGWFLTFRAFRPIRQIVQTVQGILSTGRRSERVPEQGQSGELEELVTVFNQMLDKNESLIDAMHQSLDNVAHDLRTPMTRLRGAAEFALQDPDNQKALREALADCLEESERVLTMLHTLMDVAEAETGAVRLEITDVSVPELINNIVELYEFVAEEKHITIHTELPEDLTIEADRNRIQQVIANLVDNAIKYSGDGREVTITAHEKNRQAVIAVKDRGIGISPNEIDKIWDRLYRGDRSRSERGLGLGLSFVRAIVRAHNGTVEAKSELNRGATFTVTLPVQHDAAGAVRAQRMAHSA
jgi:signal transduction histidine kinase